MPPDLTDDQSILVQVMVAASHYLRQSWPRSMSPYGVIRLQWYELMTLGLCLDRLCLQILVPDQLNANLIEWDTDSKLIYRQVSNISTP